MIEMIVENSFDIIIAFRQGDHLLFIYLAVQKYAKKLDAVMT